MHSYVGFLALMLQGAAPLGDLVEKSEHIEIGRIGTVRAIAGIEGYRIASVRVERSVWAADYVDRLEVLIPNGTRSIDDRSMEGHLEIWFLASNPFTWDEFGSEARRELYGT